MVIGLANICENSNAQNLKPQKKLPPFKHTGFPLLKLIQTCFFQPFARGLLKHALCIFKTAAGIFFYFEKNSEGVFFQSSTNKDDVLRYKLGLDRKTTMTLGTIILYPVFLALNKSKCITLRAKPVVKGLAM